MPAAKNVPPLRSFVAIFACFVGRLITNGSIGCLGVYYDSIKEAFGRSNFETSFLFSLAGGSLPGTGLIVSFLLRKFTERQVIMFGGILAAFAILLASVASEFHWFILTFGLLNGIGQGLVYVTAPIAGSFIFKEKFHHIAISLQNCGDGVGYFIFPILYEWLLHQYHWQSSLLILSGIVLNMSVCGAVLNTPEIRQNKQKALANWKPQKKLAFCNCSLWKNPAFILLLGSAFCHQLGFSIFYTFLFPYLTAQGMSENKAAWVLTAMGIFSLIGRIIPSFLDNRPNLRRWFIYALAYLIEGSAFALMVFLPFEYLDWTYLLALAAGIATGLNGCLICCVAMDILGPEKLTDSFSYLMMMSGLAALIGAPLGGILKDWTGHFRAPIALGGLVDAIGFFILLPLAFMEKYYEKRLVASDEDTETEAKKLESCNPLTGSLIELYGGPNIHSK